MVCGACEQNVTETCAQLHPTAAPLTTAQRHNLEPDGNQGAIKQSLAPPETHQTRVTSIWHARERYADPVRHGILCGRAGAALCGSCASWDPVWASWCRYADGNCGNEGSSV